MSGVLTIQGLLVQYEWCPYYSRTACSVFEWCPYYSRTACSVFEWCPYYSKLPTQQLSGVLTIQGLLTSCYPYYSRTTDNKKVIISMPLRDVCFCNICICIPNRCHCHVPHTGTCCMCVRRLWTFAVGRAATLGSKFSLWRERRRRTSALPSTASRAPRPSSGRAGAPYSIITGLSGLCTSAHAYSLSLSRRSLY